MDGRLSNRSAKVEADACLNLTRALGRTRSVDDFCGIALDALQQHLGVRRASVLLFDERGVMRFKAWRGLSKEYRRAAEGHSPWQPDDAATAEPIVVGDVTADPGLTSLLPVFQAEGIAALAFIPLIGNGRVLGKFMLYYDAPYTPDANEIEVARIVASHVAFSVERLQAEEWTRRNEARLQFALDAGGMATWEWDPRSNRIQWSENLERVHGIPPGAFDGTFESYLQAVHPDDRERLRASVQRALTTGEPHEVEYRIRLADGTIRCIEAKGRAELENGRPVRMSGVCVDVTERKEGEDARIDALQQSARTLGHLAAIVESSGDAIVNKDLDGVITSWNRAAERMFGYTAAEAIGRSITLIIPPDRLQEEETVLSHVSSGQAIEMETTRLARDGRQIPIALTVSPIRDGTGRVIGASKVARDSSDRKRAEAETARLHARLRALVSASASLLAAPTSTDVVDTTLRTAQDLIAADAYAVWTSDPEDGTWRVQGCNGVSQAFATHVVPPGTDTPAPALPPFTKPWIVRDVAAEPLLQSSRHIYRDEGIRSMLVCPMRLGPDHAGALVFYYRSSHDFPDADIEAAQTLANLAAAAMTRAELNAELRAERNAAEAARSRAAFLADATAILSRSLEYEKTLASVARLSVPEMADWCAVDILDGRELRRVAVAHIDPAKVELARRLHEQYPPDPETEGTVAHVIRTGQPCLLTELTFDLIEPHTQDEEHRRLLKSLALSSYMCVPLVSPRGTLGAITFVHAESGRKYTDRDLAFAQELAARAALALENAFAYQRVNEASRVKDEFLATLSHELRTPLNAILGYAQMLNTGVLSGNGHAKALTVLMRNAHALKQIIDDVLDVARITSGKLRLNVRPLELGEILRSAAATVQPAADAKSVDLELAIDEEAPQVLGDPDRLQQIVWNLLSNAVKFTPRGGRVRLEQSRVDGGIELVVRDNGVGIDPAFLPHIFERFRQADSRFSREHAGLGLGLAIVRDLVELHGGTVRALSEGPGKGATFIVHLPSIAAQREASLAQPPPRTAASTAPSPLSRTLKGMRILAVDNEEDALGLLLVILESAGAEVSTASSAADALGLLGRGHYDALVADIGMPNMDGLELIRRVRRLPGPFNELPAVALTAYARPEDRLAALASGFQMHLAKPVNPTELVTAVAALVGRTNTVA